MQTASPVPTTLQPVYSSSGLPRNKALVTIPSRTTTHSAPQQGANTPCSKAALERPRRPRPSVAAGRLPTRDEAPRTPGRTFGAAAEGRNVTTTRRKRWRAGRVPFKRGPVLPLRSQAPGSPQPRRRPGVPGSMVRVRGGAAHDKPKQARQAPAQRHLRSGRSPHSREEEAPGPHRRRRTGAGTSVRPKQR